MARLRSDWPGRSWTAGLVQRSSQVNPIEGLRRRHLLAACGKLVMLGSSDAVAMASSYPSAKRQMKWIAFYGEIMDERTLAGYDTVVLDPEVKGSVREVAGSGALVYAYLSLGELRSSGTMYAHVDPLVILDENRDWPGTFRIDVRQVSWRNLILDKIIPDMRHRGFTGLFLDTLDTPPFLEQVDPIGSRGMRNAAVQLVSAIRTSFPDLRLLLNRGYALLPDVIGWIDGLVAESLMTRFDPEVPSGFRWNSPAEIALQISLITEAMRRGTKIPVFTLDYWSSDDIATIKDIYRRERELGYHPYVGMPALNSIIAEPA